MAQAPIKIGVIGAGNNTRVRHFPGLQAIDGVELMSVCNRSRESSQRVADQFNIPKVYEDWHELLADPEINAVVIGTWPYMHCELTCAALEAGKHVMCEARMAMNAAEAHTMLQTSQKHPNLVAQIVPSPFTFRIDRTIKELMADGYLGDLYHLVVRGGGSEFANLDAPIHWRQQKRLSGYNILNMGIWYEGSMRWVGHAKRVFAQTRIVVPKRRDPETGTMVDVDVPDHVDILTELPGGAQGSYQFSSVSGLGQGQGAWLFGSKGTLHFDQPSNKLLGGKPGDKELREIVIPPEKAGKWRVEEEFANAIRGVEKITHTNFDDGVKYMEFTEAVHRSAESGRAVSLPLIEFNA